MKVYQPRNFYEEDIFHQFLEVVDKANGIYMGVNLSGITSKRNLVYWFI